MSVSVYISQYVERILKKIEFFLMGPLHSNQTCIKGSECVLHEILETVTKKMILAQIFANDKKSTILT